uniref:SP110 nuclear body protein variant 17 n=1 Tax=Sus scrofa TaxID=9823 RepID=S5A5K9_PIG|nr:SP110 nuclear body protein variant 17 [Sus scrofa]AGP75636.1 SP110 nuclear body protein variant 25 [Sus scrofa]
MAVSVSSTSSIRSWRLLMP